jgi:hypothetical protein
MTDPNQKTPSELDQALADFTDQVLTRGAAQPELDVDPGLADLQETVLLLKKATAEEGVSREAALRMRARLVRRFQQEMPQRSSSWMGVVATLRQHLGVVVGSVVVVALAITWMVVQPGSLPADLPGTATGGNGWLILLVIGVISVIIILILCWRSRK